jgi:hypothetical protein
MQDQANSNELDFSAVIRELRIAELPPEEQEEVLGDIIDTVNMRGVQRLAEALTPEQQEQLNQLTQENPDQAQELLLQLVPKEQQTRIYQEELDAVKEEIKKDAGIA